MREPFGFTVEQVSRLTGLSERQLRYWDETGFFSPRYGGEERRLHDRLYDFRDVVGLRTVALLRKTHRVSLQELRKLEEWLRQHYDSPWSDLTFYVGGGRVYFDDPETGARIATQPRGQTAQPFEMLRIAREVQEGVEQLRRRTPDEIGKVMQRKYLAQNKPVLAGTRIPTTAIWDFHRAGYNTASIIEQYPQLTPDDIQEAISFEAERLRKRAG